MLKLVDRKKIKDLMQMLGLKETTHHVANVSISAVF